MKPPTTAILTPAALTLCLLCTLAIAAGCGKPDSSSVVKSSFTDARDGKEYSTVRIGELTWMAENLNFAADSSWCYDNDDANCEKYGRLYAWNAAMKDCPAGWRLPDYDDWIDLVLAAGRFGPIKKLKSKSGWDGTDKFDFSAMPGGYHNTDGNITVIHMRGGGSDKNRFRGIGEDGYWWSATTTEHDSGCAYHMRMYSNWVRGRDILYNKEIGFSVRCVQK